MIVDAFPVLVQGGVGADIGNRERASSMQSEANLINSSQQKTLADHEEVLSEVHMHHVVQVGWGCRLFM